MEPNSLWASLLKARYFPNCSFFYAKKGGRVSWAWSSLLIGKDLLKRDSHWQIINGCGVRVWVDRWLPTVPGGCPSPLGVVPVSKRLKVSSLICPVSGAWNIDFLDPFLDDVTKEAILGTFIGDSVLKDRLIWPFDKREGLP